MEKNSNREKNITKQFRLYDYFDILIIQLENQNPDLFKFHQETTIFEFRYKKFYNLRESTK